MPKIMTMVPETESTVVRPIVTEVVRRLMDITGIPQDTTQIFYPREGTQIAQTGSTITGDPLPNTTSYGERVAIEVNEEYLDTDLHSVAVNRPENRLVFLDDDLDVVLRPVYVTSTMTLSVTYRAPDETRAKQWRDRIYLQMSMLEQPHLMEATYSFVVPNALLVILQEIHRLRELNQGYGQDWPTYFNDNSSQLLAPLSNLIGNQQVLAVSESQIRIPATFDFTGEPERGGREEGGEAWKVSFSYKFQYAKPVAFQMAYPLVVHNQPLSDKFRQDKPMDTYNNHQIGFGASMQAFAQFEGGSWVTPTARRQGYAIPDFDEFIPEYIIPSTQRVVTAIVLLENDSNTIMNLGAIDDDFEFKPHVLDFLRSEAPSLTKPYKSIFHLSLYRNIDLMEADNLQVNFDLDVSSTRLLSQRYYYHVRMSMVNDLRLVDRDGLDRARSHGAALVEILKAIEPTLEGLGLLPKVNSNDYVTRADLEAVMRYLERGIRTVDATTIHQFNTVQTFFIKTRP